ncbi:YdcF family protein [Lolliginicoccus suaedae]|uniref:YdcF family protein n=1 Tax=Lolliginicoccus suaedae TaxID=2605429 RepID=UPI0011EEAF69|nr:YdcF family protein [Lolliginicoccus suaedae]
MLSLVIALVLGLALWRSWRTENRRLRNGFLLLGTVWFGAIALVELVATVVPGVRIVWFAAFLLLPFLAIAMVGFLLANGVVMMQREGRNLGNLLSFLVGLALLVLPLVALQLLRTGQPALAGVAVFLFLAGIYLTVLFLVVAAYAVFYGLVVRGPAPGAIVVLGAGLLEGGVPPLLRHRLDRAIRLWQASEATARPMLVPSGGQGPDEPRAEGTAMAEYLRAAGIPKACILVEDQARDTEENLRYSSRLLAAHTIPGPVVVVTSNYHALRAALTARAVGLDADVVGSRTAAYFLPSAFLREFVAILVERARITVVVLTGCAGLAVLAGLVVAG